MGTTLNRETAPPANEKPGVLPQHFDSDGTTLLNTGKENPLPAANYVQNDSGVWVPVSSTNRMPTDAQLTGSLPYKEEQFLNIPYSDVTDINLSYGLPDYNKMIITVTNNTGQTIDLTYFTGVDQSSKSDGSWINESGSLTSLPKLECPQGARTFFNYPVAPYIVLGPSFVTAPTSGTYSIYVYYWLEP